MNWIRENKTLLAILALGLLLRLIGIDFGLPHFFVGDEQSQLGASLVMLKSMNLIPGAAPQDFNLLYYPPVMSYFYLAPLVPVLLVWALLAGIPLNELGSTVVLDPTVPWIVGRVLIAVLGTLSVYLVYLLGQRVFNKTVGLAAAFFLATSFLHLSLSHFTRHWVPSALFEILAMLAAYNIYRFGRAKDYVWSAVFVAMSFGVGFIGIVSAFFPVIAHFARSKFTLAFKDKKLWLFVISLLLLVIVIVALYPQRFLEISQGTDISVSESKTLAGFFGTFVFHTLTLQLADPVLAVLALVGLITGFRLARGVTWAFLVYSILYIASLFFVIHNEPRYILLLYPGFAVLAGLPIAMLVDKLKQVSIAKATAIVLLLIFLGYPFLIAGQLTNLLTKDDTRMEAQKWIEENVESGSKVVSYIKPEVLIPNKQSINRQRELAPDSLRTKERLLLELPEEQYPKSYDLWSISKVGIAEDFQPEYSVLQYWDLRDFAEIPGRLKSDLTPTVFGSGIRGGVDFLGNFDAPSYLLFEMRQFGPTIEIHKLQ